MISSWKGRALSLNLDVERRSWALPAGGTDPNGYARVSALHTHLIAGGEDRVRVRAREVGEHEVTRLLDVVTRGVVRPRVEQRRGVVCDDSRRVSGVGGDRVCAAAKLRL